MACPFFIPTAPLGDLVSIAPPLGDFFDGHCAADLSASIDVEILRRHCNFGYARGCCERAARSEADAVRLMVRGQRGSVVEIAWSIERNHHPVAVGRIDVETTREPLGDVLTRQAHACAMAYMRKTQGVPVSVRQTAATAHP
jgi:hypothetical protein